MLGPPNINSLVFPKSSFQLIFFSLFSPCSLFSLLSVLSVVVLISTDFFSLSSHRALSSLFSLCSLWLRRGGGYGVVVVGYGVVVVTAWWWLVTAWWWLRRGGGWLRRGGGYAWWWLRRGGGYGVVVVTERPTAWWWLRRDPRRGSFLRSVTTEASHHQGETHAVALFSDLSRPRPATTTPRSTNHGGGAFRSPRWLLVVEICWFLVAEIWWFWLLRFPVVVVVAGGKKLFVC
jgi:hypothetical protein